MKCKFTEEKNKLYWDSCNLKYGCGNVGCFRVTGDGYYNDAGGWTGDESTVEHVDLEPEEMTVNNILTIADEVGVSEALAVALQFGYSA